MNRTKQAFRQAVYAALTSPQLTYQINANAPVTLPIANVVPRAAWIAGDNGAPPPMPLVAFSVATRGDLSRQLSERQMTLKVWCVSSNGPDECEELYEAVRARLHTADQDNDGTVSDLSRAATASTLPITVRECVELRASDPDFEEKTQRWYVVGDYRVVAT